MHITYISIIVISFAIIGNYIMEEEIPEVIKEEPKMYEIYEPFIRPNDTINFANSILGHNFGGINNVMLVQYHIYDKFNITSGQTMYPLQTIENRSGSHNSLILLEYSIFYELDSWILVVNFENKTIFDENHISILTFYNGSAMISDFYIPLSKVNYVCRLKDAGDLLYDILVYTDIDKYEVKNAISFSSEYSFEDNIQFSEWLNRKTIESYINVE